MTEPTPAECERAAMRADIAARQHAQHLQALTFTEAVFGDGWIPTGKHFLVDKEDERRARETGSPMVAAATVYSAAKDGAKRLFYFIDGRPTECASVETGFGAMLHETHPTLGFLRKGQWAPYPRYSLYWSGFEPGYRPKNAA